MKTVLHLNEQVLKVMVMEGEIDKEKWKMPCEEEEEFRGFEDLECESECESDS